MVAADGPKGVAARKATARFLTGRILTLKILHKSCIRKLLRRTFIACSLLQYYPLNQSMLKVPPGLACVFQALQRWTRNCSLFGCSRRVHYIVFTWSSQSNVQVAKNEEQRESNTEMNICTPIGLG